VHLVDEPEAARGEPPFFAVELHDRAAPGGPQPLHLLHRGASVTARSRHPDRILRALIGQLATYGDLHSQGLGVVHAIAVGRRDRAVLMAPPADPVRFRRELARRDVLVADLPVALVDWSSGEIVVGAPGLTVDAAPIDELEERGERGEPGEGSSSEPPPLPWGRYGTIALALAGSPSPSAALLALGPEAGDHHDHDDTVRALLALIESVPVTGATDPDSVTARLGPA
jgi:hypothetical protein